MQTFFGIDWYDSGARFQTTDGIFSGIDPLSEQTYRISPYAYCAGDPVNKVDQFGDAVNIPIALAGAAIDYGFQVYGNYKKGFTGRDMWYGEIDFANVVLSGMNPYKKIGLAAKVAYNVTISIAQESVSITPNKRVQLKHDFGSIITNAAVNTMVDFGVEGVSVLTKKLAREAEIKASDAAWNAKHTRNISDNRPSSTVRATKAEIAAIVAQQAREEEVATKVLSKSFDYTKGILKQGFNYWYGE